MDNSRQGGRAAPAPTLRSAVLPLGLFGGWWAITLAWWALAFLSVTPATPAWLARTQSVCFGTLANGLPDTYGWTRLAVVPLAMLAPLLMVHGGGLLRGLGALWARLPGRALVAAVALLTVAEAGWVGARVQAGLALETVRVTGAEQPLPDHYPRLDRPAPDFRLTDQRGRELGLAELRGQVVFLTFAFAHCEATCPLTVRRMAEATRRARGLGALPVVVTLDPWRDTPSSLATVAEQWGLDGLGHVLSGNVPQVLGVLSRYEVPSQRDLNTGEISHPALVYVIDREGRIAYLFNNPSADWLVAAGRRAAQG